ncbi:helicase [Aureococcus anophagefferens]|nr:helicase [Aureococcus anophagefferens]
MIARGGDRRDLLIRARTGSGKTACYALPILDLILKKKAETLEGRREYGGVLAVALVPTLELVAQAATQLRELAAYCRDDVAIVALRGESAAEDAAQADLVLSFGYDEDVAFVARELGVAGDDAADRVDRPQGFLLSATLGDDVLKLKKLALKGAATVKLDERAGVFGGDRDDEAQLAQYYVPVAKGDKYLVTYVMLKLALLEGRGVLFVNSVDACYKLKLFLDLFSIRCLVLNAELPLASRLHAIESYNRGLYDILVATDASVEATPARLAFDGGACEPFRYRVSDVQRGVTAASVRDARAAELRKEMLDSEALKAHFSDNPDDLAVLQQTKAEHHKKHGKGEFAKKAPKRLKKFARTRASASHLRRS